jgi:phage baseplate assembly protein W
MTRYRGFSTVGRSKKFRVVDAELIKQDLINHFNIRRGEKLMNPNFGTIIWNTLFEPLTDEIKNVIIDDIKTIAAYDPRLGIENVIITQYEQGLQIELELLYVTTNQTDTLKLMFDKNSRSLASA